VPLHVAPLVRTTLRRARFDAAILLGGWLLLAAATTAVALGAIYADSLARAGIRSSVAAAPPDARIALVSTTAPGSAAGAIDAAVSRELVDVLGPGGGEVARIAKAGWIGLAEEGATGPAITGVSGYEHIERHAELVDGRWPEAGRQPVEATLPDAVAQALGVGIGQVLELDAPGAADGLTVTLVGTWRADADDPYWQGIAGDEVRATASGRSPVAVALDDALLIGGRPLQIEWRAIPALEHVGIGDATNLRADLDDLRARIAAASPGQSFTVRTSMSELLVATTRAASATLIAVLAVIIEFGIMAAYALVLVAGLLIERRRVRSALLEARGAGSGHLGGLALGEALLLMAPTVILAPVIALAVAQVVAGLGPLSNLGLGGDVALTQAAFVVPLIAALLGTLGLTIPALMAQGDPSQARARAGRQAGATIAQRAGLDVALVIVAALGLWQFQQHGSEVVGTLRGSTGLDPAIVVVPALGLLAGGILVTRLMPRAAALLELAIPTRSGLVLALGSRQLARRPLRYTRSALLLVLAVALGAFSAVYAATWTRSQQDQAAYRAATDVRVVISTDARPPDAATGAQLAGLDGVEELAAVRRLTIDVGRAIVGGSLVALDPSAAERLLSTPPEAPDPGWTALAQTLEQGRPEAGIALDPAVQRLALVVDSHIVADPSVPPPNDVPADHPGVFASALVMDGLGTILRIQGDTGVFVGDDQRLAIPLTTTSGGEEVPLVGPVRLLGVELTTQGPDFVVSAGDLRLAGVETSASPDGDDWAPLNGPLQGMADGSWAWTPFQGTFTGDNLILDPEADPGLLTWGGGTEADPSPLPPIFGPQQPALGVRLWDQPVVPEVLQVLASRSFMDALGAQVGDEINATVLTRPFRAQIAGVVERLPPDDPSEPFLVVDWPTMAIRELMLAGDAPDASEWWIATDPGREADVVAAIDPAAIGASAVTGRESLAGRLGSNPFGVGVLGALLIGVLTVTIIGTIGFVVSTLASIEERLEEFSILEALGLSSRQLGAWMALESVLVVAISVVSGLVLGTVLAWIVLPSASMTADGSSPVPAPTLVIPWLQLLVLAVGAFLVAGASTLMARRQLSRFAVRDALRGDA
jgi:hypothetical protein